MANKANYPGLRIDGSAMFFLDVGYAVGVAKAASPHDERIARVLEELHRQSYNSAARAAGLPEIEVLDE